nr:hypothetical protein [Tanacetum cinerariifolium]
MNAILKQCQATSPPAFVKAVEEICVTCGGAHPYYQCLAANGNTFIEFRDNIQGYVSVAAVNYNQGNSGYRPSGVAYQIRPSGFAQPNVQINQNRFSQPQGYNRGNNFNQDSSYQAPIQQNQVVLLSELEKIKKMNEINIKSMQTQINNVKNELRNEMKTSIQASMSNQTNKLKNMMASFFKMNSASTSGSGRLLGNTIANPKGELKSITTRSGIILDGPSVPMPPPLINPEEDERVEETLTDPKLGEFIIKVPPPPVQKAKPPSQRNYLVHQRDPLHPNIHYPSRMHKQKQQDKDEIQIHKFWQMFKQLHINITLANALLLIPNELKCKALADLGASINLMPLSVWKKFGLPELISTRMTLELANWAICTPAGIAKDVFVPVGKLTFPANFFIIDYEIDPSVPLILGRPFLRTVRALIDVHEEEMILRDGDERLTLNMRHDTLSYSNQPQKESINSYFFSHTDLTSPEVKDDIFDPEGDIVLIEKLLNLDSTKDLPPPHDINLLSGSTTSSSPNHLLEEFEMDSILKDSIDEDNVADPNDNLFDTILEMFIDEHALDYSSPPLYDDYNDDLFDLESSNFFPSSEYDSFLFEDFFEVDALPLTNNKDKVSNPRILIQENLSEVIVQVTPVKNENKIFISHASLILEDFNPPLYELPFHKEVPGSETLLSFSSKNEEKVFKPRILTSKGVHTSLLSKLSHRGSKAFKIIKILESPMEIFPWSDGEDIRTLDVLQPFILEESPVDTMANQHTMAELLRAPTEGYSEAIVVPPILAEQFELKHSLINMMTTDQVFGLEKDNPHDHIRWFNKITSTIKYKDNEKSPYEISIFQQRFDESFHEAWDRYKDLLRACFHHGFTEFHQLDTFYNALNPADQDSLNFAAGGNMLERRTQDVLTIIENKSKVCNSRNKSIVSQVKSNDANSSSSSEISKLTHAVNQQTSDVTTGMNAILKQCQATSPSAFGKAVEEICVTCGGAHPYYQCLAANENTFLEFRDNIQGYVSAAAVNYNQGNSGYRPSGVAYQIRPLGFAQPNVQINQNRFSQPQGYNQGNNFNQDSSYQAPIQQNQVVPLSELEKIKKINEINIKSMQTQINNVKNELRNEMKTSIQASMSNQTNELKNMMASFFQMNTASTSGSGRLLGNTIANPKGELKSITTRSGIILDGPSVPMPPLLINLEEDERVEETLTDPKLGEFIIKVPPPLVQKAKPPSQRNYVVHQRDPLHPNIHYPSRMHKQKQQDKDEIQIHKFWQMFKQLHINITLTNALLLIPNELKCKALADLGASINLMPLSVWKKFGLPKLISNRMTIELANWAICTPARIAKDVFVLVGKLTFPANFFIIDYEIDPSVPLILGRPFLCTVRALIDVHGEEMILRDGDEKLTLNMRHDTSSYSNQPQKESINVINIFNDSCEDYLYDLFATNHQRGSPTFFSHTDLTSPEVKHDIFDPEGDIVLIEKLLNLDSTKYLPPPHDINPLSGSTTSYSPNHLLEEFEMDSILKDTIDEDNLADPNDNLFDTILEMFIDEHALDYSSPPLYDDYNDDLFDLESSDFFPSSEYDSFLFEDFFEVDALPLTNNKDKVSNPRILIQENLSEVIVQVTPVKNEKKIFISHASLILEDFNPPLYELPFHKEVPGSETLLSFSSKNKEKVFKPRILTSKGVHTSLLSKLSHRGSKAFKIIKILESPMEIFPWSYGEDIRTLDVLCLHFYPP